MIRSCYSNWWWFAHGVTINIEGSASRQVPLLARSNNFVQGGKLLKLHHHSVYAGVTLGLRNLIARGRSLDAYIYTNCSPTLTRRQIHCFSLWLKGQGQVYYAWFFRARTRLDGSKCRKAYSVSQFLERVLARVLVAFLKEKGNFPFCNQQEPEQAPG